MNAVTIYSALLRLLPREFRQRYGDSMLTMFEDEWRATSGLARVRLGLRSLRGLLWTALVVRLSSEYATGLSAHSRSGGGWFTGAGADTRAALRGLARRPGFTAAAVATSALGIGAMVSVFSVVDQTVLRSLDLPDQKRVVGFWTSFESNAANEYQVSMAELADIRADLQSFDRLGAWSTAQTTTFTPKSGDSRSVAVVQTIGDVYALGERAHRIWADYPTRRTIGPLLPPLRSCRTTSGCRHSVAAAMSLASSRSTQVLEHRRSSSECWARC